MSLYAIGDLHLSFGAPEKTMEVFGGRWTDYHEKIRRGMSFLTEDDICVICGDFCWAMDMQAALPDFQFLHSFPCKKLLLKGNHDYWWTTATKMKRFLAENGFDDISILHNNCFLYGDKAICGTRGWFYEEITGTEHDTKILNREVGRLRASLQAAGDREKLVFLHYPPIYQGYTCPEILTVLDEFGVHECSYGHIHGTGSRAAFLGERNGTRFRLISADYLDFIPQILL